MNKLDQTATKELDQAVEQHLRTIGESCPRLLYALQANPEAVWGEIMRLESACQAFKHACGRPKETSAAVREIMTLVSALRGQMAKDGLMVCEELAAFRKGVSDIQGCAHRLRTALGHKAPQNQHPLKTCVFYCSNNLDAGRLAGFWGELGGDTVKTIGLPCSGKVDVPYLVKALETGADGVVVVACQKKQCRHFEGSARAHKRAQAVEGLLAEIGFGAGRIAVIECAEGGAGQACDEIKRFIEQVRSLPSGLIPHGAVQKQERMVA